MTCHAGVMDDDPRFRFSRPGGGGSGWRSHASWRTSAVLCNQIMEWCTFNENENAVDPAVHCASRDNDDQSRPIATVRRGLRVRTIERRRQDQIRFDGAHTNQCAFQI
jgi:hypothetical protein